MNNDFEKYLLDSKCSKKYDAKLLHENLITGVIINIKRIILELEELEKTILDESHGDDFSTLISGAQLENIKREILKIKQEYPKK